MKSQELNLIKVYFLFKKKEVGRGREVEGERKKERGKEGEKERERTLSSYLSLVLLRRFPGY